MLSGALVLGWSTVGCAAQTDAPSLGVPGSPPGAGSTRGPNGELSQNMVATQEQLEVVATQIEQDRPDSDIPGLGGMSFDLEGRALDVYWVSNPPARVRHLAARPPAGVSIRVHSAAYDISAMTKAMDKLFDRYGDFMHSGGISAEGAGLQIEQTAADAENGPSVDEMAAVAGMPVATEVSDPPVAVGG